MSNINQLSFNHNKFNDSYSNFKNQSPIMNKVTFMPIIDNNNNNINILNISSYPIHNNNNNTSLFSDNSFDYKTIYKIRAPLNINKLPPVFEIPEDKITQKINLKPIKNNYYYNNNNNENNNNYNNSNYFYHNNINSNINNNYDNNYNNENNQNNNNIRIGGKPLLKPIKMKIPFFKGNKIKHNDINIIKANNGKSIEKFSRTSEHYYNITNNNQNEISKNNIVNKNTFINNNNNNNYTFNKINDKINNIFNIDHLYNSDLFLSINKSHSRFLFLPSLLICYSYIIPFNNNNIEKIFDYLTLWKQLPNNYFKEILTILENKEKKYYNIITNKNYNGTLINLLKSTGSLTNEFVLRNLVREIIIIIKEFNKFVKKRNFNKFYNIINLNNIVFDNNNQIKLFPGLIYDFNNNNNNENIIEKIIKEININLDEECEKFYLNLDYFNLGISLLNLLLFCLDLNIEKDFLNDNFNLNDIKNNCCLYHYLNKINSNFFKNLINKFSFSIDFENFLHLITNFKNNNDNFNENDIENILENNWFNVIINNNINSKNNLTELIKIGKNYNFENEYFTGINEIENIDLLCFKINNNLKYCYDYFDYNNIKSANVIFAHCNIEDLSKELRVNKNDIESTIYSIYINYFNNYNNKNNNNTIN